jgi:hypothetical protein
MLASKKLRTVGIDRDISKRVQALVAPAGIGSRRQAQLQALSANGATMVRQNLSATGCMVAS